MPLTEIACYKIQVERKTQFKKKTKPRQTGFPDFSLSNLASAGLGCTQGPCEAEIAGEGHGPPRWGAMAAELRDHPTVPFRLEKRPDMRHCAESGAQLCYVSLQSLCRYNPLP